MFTLTWLRDAAERVISTFAIALLGIWAGDSFDVLHVDWKAALGVAGGQALLSLLKAFAVGASPIGTPGTATPVDLTASTGRHEAA